MRVNDPALQSNGFVNIFSVRCMSKNIFWAFRDSFVPRAQASTLYETTEKGET